MITSLGQLEKAIEVLEKASDDSNSTVTITTLERFGFTKKTELEKTPLYRDVMEYIKSQERASSKAACDENPFAVKRLKGIYHQYSAKR